MEHPDYQNLIELFANRKREIRDQQKASNVNIENQNSEAAA